ncbi:MAG: thioredoxin family protein [Bacteroidota bacterium]
MDKVIERSLQKAYSYNEYKEMIVSLLKEDKATGNMQSPQMVDFTKLNQSRMKRLDKQTKLMDAAETKVQQIDKDFTWLVLTESWCGDAAHTLPIINKLSEANPRIDLKVVLRDENEDLMDQFLTNGTKSIPKLIALENHTGKVINSWGPRSKNAAQMVLDYKTQNGGIDENFKKELQMWYHNDKGESIQKDMIDFLDEMI